MRRPLPPVKKAYRHPVRDRSYVDSPAELERQLAVALERTKARLAVQREEVARREKARR